MGRISDAVPPLYFTGKNDLRGFLEALDVQTDKIESKVKGITDLIDVDRCPDDKLPYLAALTGCPLIGEEPKLWRRQIRNWPYLLKYKGTEKSLDLALESIGADSYEIRTYFRDAGGGYTTQKPEGEPFKNQINGLWYNSRTHYFGVELKLGQKFITTQDYNWDAEEFKAQLAPWIEMAKPFHAELLGLAITPPDYLPEGHICRWDVCTWEHAEIKEYGWGGFEGSEINGEGQQFGRCFDRPLLLLNDAFWDMLPWESLPYCPRIAGRLSITGLFGSLGDWDGSTALYPMMWDSSRWDYSTAFQRTFGRIAVTGVPCESHLDDEPPQCGAHSVVMFFGNSTGIGWAGQHAWDHYPTWEDVFEDYSPHSDVGFMSAPAFFCGDEITVLYPMVWDDSQWGYSVAYQRTSEIGIGNLEKRYTNWSAFRAWDSHDAWDDASKVQFVELDIWKEEL